MRLAGLRQVVGAGRGGTRPTRMASKSVGRMRGRDKSSRLARRQSSKLIQSGKLRLSLEVRESKIEPRQKQVRRVETGCPVGVT